MLNFAALTSLASGLCGSDAHAQAGHCRRSAGIDAVGRQSRLGAAARHLPGPLVPAPFDRRPAYAARDRDPGRRECGLAARSRTVEPSAFDPGSIRRTFRIAAMDFGVTMLAPHLIELIARDAPGVQLSLLALSKAEALRSLADGQIDIAIAVFHEAPPGFRHRVLAKESFVTVARKKHPKLRGGLSLCKMQGRCPRAIPRSIGW